MAKLSENALTPKAMSFLTDHRGDIRIAIVCARFNSHITESLLHSTQERLLALGLNTQHITVTLVPGSIEIPLTVQKFARSKQFQAIIALGAVIRGETSHYDYVCEQVSAGCLRVSLDEHIPVIFGVLTTENEAQAMARVNSGIFYAESAIEMMALIQ